MIDRAREADPLSPALGKFVPRVGDTLHDGRTFGHTKDGSIPEAARMHIVHANDLINDLWTALKAHASALRAPETGDANGAKPLEVARYLRGAATHWPGAEHVGVPLGPLLAAADFLDRAYSAQAAASGQGAKEPVTAWCDRCDGCGWYEGGSNLQMSCEKCGGTGRESQRPAEPRLRRDYATSKRESDEATAALIAGNAAIDAEFEQRPAAVPSQKNR